LPGRTPSSKWSRRSPGGGGPHVCRSKGRGASGHRRGAPGASLLECVIRSHDGLASTGAGLRH
jgi:hypothetical protein